MIDIGTKRQYPLWRNPIVGYVGVAVGFMLTAGKFPLPARIAGAGIGLAGLLLVGCFVGHRLWTLRRRKTH